MPESLGSVTTSVIIGEFSENVKHEGFVVGATDVKVGQPVKLDSTGKVVPIDGTDKSEYCIGTSIHNGTAGDTVTVASKFRGIVNALAGGAVTPGPVKYSAFDATTGLCKYVALGANEEGLTVGWAMTVAAADGDALVVALR
jgi:hypothetical protein